MKKIKFDYGNFDVDKNALTLDLREKKLKNYPAMHSICFDKNDLVNWKPLKHALPTLTKLYTDYGEYNEYQQLVNLDIRSNILQK